jgi:hypothetical protein
MNRLKPDGRQFGRIIQTLPFRIGQLFQTQPNRNGMIARLDRGFLTLTAGLDERARRGPADPFDAAARQHALVGHVEEPIFEARAAQVGD